MAAVLYVFRTLVDKDIPLNAGCLKPLKVIIPPGTMLSPEYPAAVAAGNVETSQAVTGALYAALGIWPRAGTMNNVTFGNARHQYYETVASGPGGPGLRRHGCGADEDDELAPDRPRGPRMALPGAPGVLRDPPRQRRPGRWHGGDGGTGGIRFLEPMTVTTLIQPPPHPRLRPGTAAPPAPSAATGSSTPTAPSPR